MAKQQRVKRSKAESDAASGSSRDATSSMPEQQLVVFCVAAEQLAFALKSTAEIIRAPALAQMPLGPASLLGLANLRGMVLPIVSLRKLLGFADRPADEATRIIVMSGAAPVGFAVDRIENLLSVKAERMESGNSGAGTIDPAFVEGAVRGADGFDTIKILDPKSLLDSEFSTLNNGPRQSATLSAPGSAPLTSSPNVSDHVSFVSFDLGEQEYAVPLQDVKEIIPLPDHVAEVARSETAVLGVVTLRNRLLPIVSLRMLLGMAEAHDDNVREKVVVLSMGNTEIGFVADNTREILRVDPRLVDPAPSLLTRGAGDAEIASICRMDGGKRLVAILSPARLFRSELMQRLMAEHTPSQQIADVHMTDIGVTEEQFAIFRLGAQEYGIPIAAVQEIARLPEQLTTMPKAPKFIDGVINLRGNVVPIIDMRRRFEVSSADISCNQRVLILSFSGGATGFIVDEVSEVLKIDSAAIQAAPELSLEQIRLIGRVANLSESGRMILLIDPIQLLDRVETDVLEKFAPRQSEKTLSPT